jgi:hypothetical protein
MLAFSLHASVHISLAPHSVYIQAQHQEMDILPAQSKNEKSYLHGKVRSPVI